MKKFIPVFSIVFFGFILWVIYLANTGRDSIFFELVRSIPYGDKLGHFCLFGILTLGVNFALKLKTLIFRSYKLYFGSILVLCFAATEELSQYFIPNRTLDSIDFIADISGIAFFSLLTKLINNYSHK